jgi:hypothetical protein
VSRLDKLRETHPALVEYIVWSSLAVTIFAAALLAYYFHKDSVKRRQRPAWVTHRGPTSAAHACATWAMAPWRLRTTQTGCRNHSRIAPSRSVDAGL